MSGLELEVVASEIFKIENEVLKAETEWANCLLALPEKSGGRLCKIVGNSAVVFTHAVPKEDKWVGRINEYLIFVIQELENGHKRAICMSIPFDGTKKGLDPKKQRAEIGEEEVFRNFLHDEGWKIEGGPAKPKWGKESEYKASGFYQRTLFEGRPSNGVLVLFKENDQQVEPLIRFATVERDDFQQHALEVNLKKAKAQNDQKQDRVNQLKARTSQLDL